MPEAQRGEEMEQDKPKRSKAYRRAMKFRREAQKYLETKGMWTKRGMGVTNKQVFLLLQQVLPLQYVKSKHKNYQMVYRAIEEASIVHVPTKKPRQVTVEFKGNRRSVQRVIHA